jgi:hypothetical protein
MFFLRSGWCWPGNGGNGPQRSWHCSQGKHALRIEEGTGHVVFLPIKGRGAEIFKPPSSESTLKFESASLFFDRQFGNQLAWR